ncbi:MAG TPA: hypothetical protein VII56_06505 [Rhizomicrobium sp.]
MANTLSSIAPKSAERKTRALRYLGRSQSFAALKIPDESDSKLEPIDYESTRSFASEINGYYKFHINYAPFFERGWNLLRPARWLYYIDINDETIEQKFPRDQDIRAIITAFRYSIVRNRHRIIRLKRTVQALSILALMVPAIAFAYWPQLFGNLISMAVLVLVALGTTLGVGGYQIMRDSQLKSVLQSNGAVLANKVQGRANDLNRHFQEFFARIDREETNEDMANPEWTHRSAWWMKLCLWYPRRIESIELFLQSEMQRTRIFMLRSAWAGYGSAVLVLLILPALAALAIALKHLSLTEPAWWFWLGGTALSVVLTMYSVRTSIHLSHISGALGKEPLGTHSRFADLELHEKLAAQVRRDKERLRKFYLRGGFGENHKQSN